MVCVYVCIYVYRYMLDQLREAPRDHGDVGWEEVPGRRASC